jgi:cysteine-S-conjugate beta-lyase
MKHYNFEKPIDRSNTNSVKWDLYGGDVLPLWVADMDFAVPPQILEAMQSRLAHPIFGYAGHDPAMLETICAWVKRRHGWDISPDQILLMPGVVTGINWVAKTFGQPERSYLIQTPVYPPFFQAAKNMQLKLIEAPLRRINGHYEIDFEDFEQKIIAGKAGIFVLCNPHNPVGRVFTRTELERMGEICLRHGVLICADEIHCDLVYSGSRHISIASLSPELALNTITLMAASKTFNIPGLHFSFAVVPNAEWRKRMEVAGAGLIGHPEIFGSAAAGAAFTLCDDWLEELLVYLEGNRDYLVGYLQKYLPGIHCTAPEGTYLAWLDCRELNLQPDPYHFFLEKARIALNNGESFGKSGEGFVRLNFGCPRVTLNTALERMRQAIEKRTDRSSTSL